MRKGRLMMIISPAFVAGAAIGQFFCIPGFSFFISIGLAAILACITYHKRSLTAMLTAFFVLGIAAAAVGGVSRDNFGFFKKAENIKHSLSQKIDNIIPEGDKESAAVAKALALGDKSALPRSLKENYRRSGASHLLALSGLHVGVMYALISVLLSILGNRPKIKIFRTIISLGTSWVYAVVTGLSSSISRAAIMITVYQMSDFLGAKRNLPHSLTLSAILITLFKPSAPFEIGFQLSYAAMLSICFIFPYLNKLMVCRSRILKYIWDLISLSISCQAGTAVLSYIYFGSFPKYFMLTNLLAIPITGIIMYLIPAASIASVFPKIGMAVSSLLSDSIHLLNKILEIIASF